MLSEAEGPKSFYVTRTCPTLNSLPCLFCYGKIWNFTHAPNLNVILSPLLEWILTPTSIFYCTIVTFSYDHKLHSKHHVPLTCVCFIKKYLCSVRVSVVPSLFLVSIIQGITLVWNQSNLCDFVSIQLSIYLLLVTTSTNKVLHS